jgi:hypothetical protein
MVWKPFFVNKHRVPLETHRFTSNLSARNFFEITRLTPAVRMTRRSVSRVPRATRCALVKRLRNTVRPFRARLEKRRSVFPPLVASVPRTVPALGSRTANDSDSVPAAARLIAGAATVAFTRAAAPPPPELADEGPAVLAVDTAAIVVVAAVVTSAAGAGAA